MKLPSVFIPVLFLVFCPVTLLRKGGRTDVIPTARNLFYDSKTTSESVYLSAGYHVFSEQSLFKKGKLKEIWEQKTFAFS